jgi:hypothetical protein
MVTRGGKNCFLSGNLGRRLEIFCKICNVSVTITKITKQMHNYCIICTLVIFSGKYSAKLSTQKNFWELGSLVPILFPPRNQTLQFWHARSSCGDGFCSSCLDQHLVCSWIAGIIHCKCCSQFAYHHVIYSNYSISFCLCYFLFYHEK